MPNDDGNIEVKYPREDFRRDTYFISPEAYDPDEHTLADGETWTPGEEVSADGGDSSEKEAGKDAPEPSDELLDLLSTRQANALARAGLATVEAAVSYHREEGDLTDLDDVGPGTVDALDLE